MSSMNEPLDHRLATGTQTFAPLYKEVKKLLTDSLVAGTWQPGEALPSETKLAQHFRVSIGTIRKAVDELVQEQVLVRQQGRGTFVAMHNTTRLMFNFFHIVPETGDKQLPTTELISFERGKADAETARKLNMLPGERTLRIVNLLSLAGEPIIVDEIQLSATLFPNVTEKTFRERDNTIYNLYQTHYGINVVRAVERLRATVADRATAKLLRVEPGAPLLQINRVALSYHNSPVELRKSLVNTTRHEYLSDLGKA